MNTVTANVGEFTRSTVAATGKILACAALSLAITLVTMLTIGDQAATRLFTLQPAVSVPSALSVPSILPVAPAPSQAPRVHGPAPSPASMA